MQISVLKFRDVQRGEMHQAVQAYRPSPHHSTYMLPATLWAVLACPTHWGGAESRSWRKEGEPGDPGCCSWSDKSGGGQVEIWGLPINLFSATS